MTKPASSHPRDRSSEASKLVGTWRKQPGSACAAAYPATLEFRADGQHRGASEPPGEYAVWDVGTWSISGANEVAISTANDAVLRYRYKLDGDTVSFVDDEGCAFAYVRTSDVS